MNGELENINLRVETIERAFINPNGDSQGSLISVPGLLVRLGVIEEFVNGDPPLEGRLLALEGSVEDFKHSTWARQHAIADLAGVPEDARHRIVIDGRVAVAEARVQSQLLSLRQELADVIRIVREHSSVVLWTVVIAALFLAVLINVGWKIFAG